MRTPFHPQWLMGGSAGPLSSWLREIPAQSWVLDVGSATGWPRQHLRDASRYVGFDYPTTAQTYQIRPEVYADAHCLPVADGAADVILLLDVLEHLRDPERALREVNRALKPGGRLILQVPFLYPLHDAPHDYTRWTAFGLRALAERAGFEPGVETHAGQPLVTAAVLGNIALVNAVLLAVRSRSPAALLAPLLPVAVVGINLFGWLLGALFPDSSLMPYSYAAVWTKARAAL